MATSRISYSTATLTLVLSVFAAWLSTRVTLSFKSLLLLSPLLILLSGLAWAALDLAATWWIERELWRRINAELDVTASAGGAGARRVPPLIFTSSSAWAATQTRAQWESKGSGHRIAFPYATPLLSGAIDELFDLVVRDFIGKWFDKISDSPKFGHEVERVIREAGGELVKRAAGLQWSDIIVGKVVPLITAHVDTFRTAEIALRGQNLKNQLTESDELDLFFASRYALETPSGKLHPAVDVSSPTSRPAEEAWLRGIIGRLLPLVLPGREGDSAAVSVMTREIVSCAVLLPILDQLSDPDLWNRLIDDKAGAAIRDQKMVEQFREALDKQGSDLTVTPITPRRLGKTEAISASTSSRQFDSFVRGISKSNSLLDVRRLRSDVTDQIRKTRTLVEGRSKDDLVEGHKVSQLIDHIERLYTAKRRADKRIEELGGQDSSSKDPVLAARGTQTQPKATLRQILLHPSSLSWFMEFQERRGHSLRVQFWLLAEGLKAPLEDLDSDDEESGPLPAPSVVATAREDTKMVWDFYFSTNALNSNQKYIRTVKAFVEADPKSLIDARELRRVRRAIFACQADVFAEMEEEDFPGFEKSELYFKALADLPDATIEPLAFVPLLAPTPPSRPTSPPSTARPPRQRTTTGPPKVSLDKTTIGARPHFSARRTASDEISPHPPNSPDPSIYSLDTGLTIKAKKRLVTPLSDSLDFLMASPSPDDDSRPPLFDSDEEGQTYVLNTPGREAELDDDYEHVQKMEAIQEALNTILATDGRNSPLSTTPSLSASQELVARSFSDSRLRKGPRVVRSPARTVSNPKSTTESFFDEDEEVDIENLEREEADSDFDPKSIKLASPGDLQLPIEIANISAKIEHLRNQEAVVGALIRKAELIGVVSELKILVKSRESLRRETRALAFQREQYEVQESENQLMPGRTSVVISGTTIGGSDVESFQLYLVEVHQLALDGSEGSGWIVTRRYSEFSTLHANLKEKYFAVRQLDLPGKRLVSSYSEGFIEHRRVGLEKYLQALVRIPIVCQSDELRAFLSQQNISLPKFELDAAAKKNLVSHFPGTSIVRSFFRSVTSGVDIFSSSGSSSMMDQVIQRLSQQANFSGVGGSGVQDEDLVLAGKMDVPLALRGVDENYFMGPICDLFVTLFELKDKQNFIRRQAILIVLQSILGTTIERKFRDAVAAAIAPDQLAVYVELLKGTLWPGGQLKPKEPPRTAAERLRTRDSANQKLATLMPEVAANLIGRANSKQGARRLFAVLQNRRLNRHLVYTLLDLVIKLLFPELSS